LITGWRGGSRHGEALVLARSPDPHRVPRGFHAFPAVLAAVSAQSLLCRRGDPPPPREDRLVPWLRNALAAEKAGQVFVVIDGTSSRPARWRLTGRSAPAST
jgi:hypothetical protein